MFCYHGAEHKTIFCYEAGLPLTVENVRIQPRHHPRCGTSFLFVVIIVSIIVSSLVFPYINWQSVWVRVGVKLLLLVPVVGITYEFNRLVGAHGRQHDRGGDRGHEAGHPGGEGYRHLVNRGRAAGRKTAESAEKYRRK